MINFEDFGFSDNERYMDYLSRCIQIPSNASPLMVLADKAKYNVKRAYVDNLCWQKFSSSEGELWGVPAGDWDEIDWKKTFKAHVPAGTVFNFVPEYLLKIWQRELGEAIEVEDDRDMWDYILDLDRLENLTGKQFKRMRNACNAFEKNYEYTVEEITPEIFNDLWQFHVGAEKNLQERVEHVDTAQDDSDAFLFAIEHWDDVKNLFGFVIRVDGHIVAYSLDETIDATHSIGLFAKADYNINGVNHFAYWYDAKISLERGIITQNLTDDAGEENLRFFKEHLYPLVMLKKYVVTYNPSEQVRDVNISSTRDGDHVTIKLSGKLNTDAANATKDEILSLLDGAKDATFDLNGLEYIASAGLRILITAMKKARAQGGTITLKNVGNQVMEVLDMTGFAQIFNLSWRPNIKS